MERENEKSLILIYAVDRSPRLQYMLTYLFEEVYGIEFQLTNDVEDFQNFSGFKICYAESKISDESIHIYPNGLLFEENIKHQEIVVEVWNDLPIFFNTPGDIPFDVFSASFFLITRYEEYLIHHKDKYGRFDHRYSLSFQHNFLHLPLVELWLLEISEQYGLPKRSSFQYKLSYDIDQAWSWKHKGFIRNLGGAIRDVLRINDLLRRLGVLFFNKQDPFHAFEWMDAIHQKYNLDPIYFFLIARKNGRYDKHILPFKAAMSALIDKYSSRSGIHPSWAAHESNACLKDELNIFKKLTGKKAEHSRYHYIAFNLPEGYRRLIDQGVMHDYSMGYGTVNGFRASTSIPFNWFDLSRNEATGLTVHPFCWMDANSFYEQKQNTEETLEELNTYKHILQKTNGNMLVIWHNNFLGTDPAFKGWRELYEDFTKDL